MVIEILVVCGVNQIRRPIATSNVSPDIILEKEGERKKQNNELESERIKLENKWKIYGFFHLNRKQKKVKEKEKKFQ